MCLFLANNYLSLGELRLVFIFQVMPLTLNYRNVLNWILSAMLNSSMETLFQNEVVFYFSYVFAKWIEPNS